jgi:hypothetical protein
LDLTTHEQIEALIRPADLDIGAQGNRVIALDERIQKLVNANGASFSHALAKVIALENARDGVLTAQSHEIIRSESAHPFGIEPHFGTRRIEDSKHLLRVRFGVGANRRFVERTTRFGATRGISDARREIAYQKNYCMAKILKLPKLREHDGMPKVQIRRARIRAELHAQRSTFGARFRDPLCQLASRQRIDDSPHELRDFVLYRAHASTTS